MSADHQVLVVGAGAAGLSAALVLGRAQVSTLVVDAGQPSNRTAPAIGGLLGQHDTAPGSLYAAGRAQLAELPSVTLRQGTVTDVAGAFTATLADGLQAKAERLVLATGMRYRPPELPGIDELWGGAVFHCPYCHGWEHRDGRLAVVGGVNAFHRARLLREWSEDVVVVATDVTTDDRDALAVAEIPIDERDVTAFEAHGKELAGLRLADGELLARDGALVAAPLEARDDLVRRLGCETTDTPIVREMVVTDAVGQTSVPGVFAAGDVAATMQQVALAIAAGSMAAIGAHRSLVFA